jgi:hypothetical protein
LERQKLALSKKMVNTVDTVDFTAQGARLAAMLPLHCKPRRRAIWSNEREKAAFFNFVDILEKTEEVKQGKKLKSSFLFRCKKNVSM